MQNDRKHRDIKLVTAEYKRNKLVSEPYYHSTKRISKQLLVMEMKKIEVKMNKPIYLGQALLDHSKTLMFEFWYDYLKPSMVIKLDYVIQILIVSSCILKQMIFTKILVLM